MQFQILLKYISLCPLKENRSLNTGIIWHLLPYCWYLYYPWHVKFYCPLPPPPVLPPPCWLCCCCWVWVAGCDCKADVCILTGLCVGVLTATDIGWPWSVADKRVGLVTLTVLPGIEWRPVEDDGRSPALTRIADAPPTTVDPADTTCQKKHKTYALLKCL